VVEVVKVGTEDVLDLAEVTVVTVVLAVVLDVGIVTV
jgi:hypothetical protein